MVVRKTVKDTDLVNWEKRFVIMVIIIILYLIKWHFSVFEIIWKKVFFLRMQNNFLAVKVIFCIARLICNK